MIKLVIIGSGGHASSVLSSLKSNNSEEIFFCGFIDSFKQVSHENLILANRIEDLKDYKNYKYFVAVGDNKVRDSWYRKIKKLKLPMINIIDKTAIISEDIKLGEGIFIGKNVTITSDVSISNNAIINTGVIIDHGSKIGESSNISPGSIINGDVCIGDLSWIGSGAIIFNQRKVGINSIIGGGSVVNKDIGDNVVFVGNPAKFLKNNN